MTDSPRHFALTPEGVSTLIEEPEDPPGPGTMIEIDDPDRPELKGHWVVKRLSLSGIDVVPFGSSDATRLMRAKAKRDRKSRRLNR